MDQTAEIIRMMDERLTRIENWLDDTRVHGDESRRRLHEKLDGQQVVLIGLDHRLEQMEKAITTTSPVFTEYMAYKQRAIGAGIMGRWLWVVGGFVLSAAAGAAAGFAWIINHIQMKP